jgi:hypothetical protein
MSEGPWSSVGASWWSFFSWPMTSRHAKGGGHRRFRLTEIAWWTGDSDFVGLYVGDFADIEVSRVETGTQLAAQNSRCDAIYRAGGGRAHAHYHPLV